MKIRIIAIITTILAVQEFTAPRCPAQSVPNLINYQGRLTDQTGAALPQGFYQIQFRLWDSPTASATNDLIWGQQQTLTVQSNGVFSTILGSGGTSIPGAIPAVNDLSFAFTQSNRYIGVTVVASNGVTITGASEILPRQQILSSPYAVTASFASTAQNAVNGAPVGSVMAFAGSVAPAGWSLCDGTAISRIAYSNLFAVVSTTYGSGDGTTSFNLPDYRGRTLVGLDGTQTEFNSLGKAGGEKTHVLTPTEMPSHVHAVTYATAHWGTSDDGYIKNNALSTQGTYNTEPAGGGQAHNNLQPYTTVNYLIKN